MKDTDVSPRKVKSAVMGSKTKTKKQISALNDSNWQNLNSFYKQMNITVAQSTVNRPQS